MAAARFWRITGVSTRAGGGLALSALYLCGPGGRADEAAVLSSSHAPIAGTLNALQDGDSTTVCRFGAAAVRSSGFWLAWDFHGGASITSLQLGGADSLDDFLSRCDIQYSGDGAAWTTLTAAPGVYTWPGAHTIGSIDGGDTAYLRTSLLLHCDGPDGSTFVADRSPLAQKVTLHGGCSLTTVQSRFGGAALDCTAAVAYASISSGVAFDFLGEPATFELWVYPLGASGFAHLLGQWGFSGGDSWHVGMDAAAGTIGVEVSGNGSYQPAYSYSSAGGVIGAGRWSHVAVSFRPGFAVDVFVAGVLVLSFPAPPSLASVAEPVTVGRNANGQQFVGYIDEVRVTKGLALYTSAFEPPVAPFGDTVREAQPIATSWRPYTLVAASAGFHAHSTHRFAPALAWDIEHGGAGRIWGTTKSRPAPNVTPVPIKARVVLLHQRSKLVVRETWSDPVTGAFEFVGLDTRQDFLTLAEDAAGNLRPVAASRLVPEVQS